MTARGSAHGQIDVWSRWREVQNADASLRVVVLASFTAEPLVPHLGMGLHESGLAAAVMVGPYNQIAQQCLDPGSETARWQPHVIIVLPRFEEAWRGLPDTATGDYSAELMGWADSAAEAANRSGAFLLFVLPPLPEGRPTGVGDHGLRAGVVATAVRVRELLRERLAGRPNIGLIDGEAVVRAIGARHAHTPAMMAFAGIPYSEEVFAGIAEDAVRLLRLRFLGARRRIVIDGDSLLFDGGSTCREGGEHLRSILERFRAVGGHVAIASRQPSAVLWAAAQQLFGADWAVLADEWQADRASDEDATVLTADPTAWSRERRIIDLGLEPESWLSIAEAAPMWDKLPEWDATVPEPQATGEVSTAALSLDDYITGLGTSIHWLPMSPGLADHVAEMSLATKDFALGMPYSGDWTEPVDTGRRMLVGEVTDRLGDYGKAVVVGASFAGGVCTLEHFYVSCPALGRGVENAALHQIASLAREQGCAQIVVRFRATGRNDLARRFLRSQAQEMGDGIPELTIEELVVADTSDA